MACFYPFFKHMLRHAISLIYFAFFSLTIFLNDFETKFPGNFWIFGYYVSLFQVLSAGCPLLSLSIVFIYSQSLSSPSSDEGVIEVPRTTPTTSEVSLPGNDGKRRKSLRRSDTNKRRDSVSKQEVSNRNFRIGNVFTCSKIVTRVDVTLCCILSVGPPRDSSAP